MKLFVLESVDELTGAFHSGGGATVVAVDIESAKELMEKTGATVTDDEWDDAIVYELAGEADEVAYVFPDAGCC